MKDNGAKSMRTIGSLTLCRSLLSAGLVDRFRVVVFPVITGSTGHDRIYDGYPDVALDPGQPHLRRSPAAARIPPDGLGRAARHFGWCGSVNCGAASGLGSGLNAPVGADEIEGENMNRLRIALAAAVLAALTATAAWAATAGAGHEHWEPGRSFSRIRLHSSRDESLTDQKDANYAALQPAYKTVTLTDLDGSGFLRGRLGQRRLRDGQPPPTRRPTPSRTTVAGSSSSR